MLRYKIIILVLVLLGPWQKESRAQDPQFTQFYAAPLYLNPAFTGNVYLGRVATNYRKQWPGIPGAFTSYTFGIDHHFKNAKSGLGILVSSDKSGSGGLKFTKFSGLYSYYVPVDRGKILRFGVSAGYAQRRIDFNSLVFGDQIATGSQISRSSAGVIQNYTYLDFGSGLLYHTSKFWAGASVNHLNRPKDGFLTNSDARIPMKLDVHTGVKVPVNKNLKGRYTNSMYFAFHYKAQGKWDQADIGTYFQHKVLFLGLWYRNIPFKNYSSVTPNRDALALVVGLDNDLLKIGYSYDITLSALSGNTGGSHEISLILEYPFSKGKRKRKRDFYLPCPKF